VECHVCGYPHTTMGCPPSTTSSDTKLCTPRATMVQIAMQPDFVLCDVFADAPFAGNPLAVFPDVGGLSDAEMFALAREFGWSEITFVALQGSSSPRVRIWTPRGELPFAGHPTVGTAVVLAAGGHIEVGRHVFELGIGPVEVEVAEVGPSGGRATMTQRAPEFKDIFDDPTRLAVALGLSEEDLAPGLPAQIVSTGLDHFMVPLTSLDALGRARGHRDLLPDVLDAIGARRAYVFTVETPQSTAAARARLLAVDYEDAATGSAAGPLGGYLVQYGLHRAGEMEIEQGIEMGRPSRILVDVPSEGHIIGPVRVSGDVRIWASGVLREHAQS